MGLVIPTSESPREDFIPREKKWEPCLSDLQLAVVAINSEDEGLPLRSGG